MTWRIGPGPVFVFECLTLARRWQIYAARVAFVLILLITLLVVWLNSNTLMTRGGVRAQAEVGVNFYYGIIGTELALVLLAAPAMTAGSICIDKSRGCLVHMLVTDLSNAEIVLGKLLSRLVPVVGLVACGLPVMFLASLLGGIDTEALLGAFLILLGVGVFTCALALLLSIWGHKTHEVLLATYLILIIVNLVQPAWFGVDAVLGSSTQPAGLIKVNPFFMAFAVYNHPEWYTRGSGSSFLGDAAIYLGASLAGTVVLLIFSVLSIRRVITGQKVLSPRTRLAFRASALVFLALILGLGAYAWAKTYVVWHLPLTAGLPLLEVLALGGFVLAAGLVLFLTHLLVRLLLRRKSVGVSRSAPRQPWRLPRIRFLKPSLEWNPVAWREWHRRRPTLWSMFINGTFWIGAMAFTGLLIFLSAAGGGGRGEMGPFVSAFQVSIGMLLVTIYAVTALSEERSRGSLDLLMVTPLSTWSIVWGKWQAAFRAVLPLAVLPAINVVAGALGGRGGRGFPNEGLGILLVPIMIVLVLSYGAAWTSLGLALATWIRRFGWAVAASVTVYLCVTVGVFIIFLAIMRGGPNDLGRNIALISPFFGPGEMTANATGFGHREWGGYIVVIFVHAFLAILFYVLTLVTFDHCLGRLTTGARRGPPRRQRPQPAPALATTS